MMKTTAIKWLRITYNKVTESIAFYPALIAVGFLVLSWLMLEIDFSEWGKELKGGLNWLSLKDASTARSIISTVAGALISLTVFSFSMVMIVLNQAASQMSNRVLTSMIENRFQQMILGFYIGTIVYALFLLSTIRDISSGIYVPALSIYLLILLTVIDIFLFIYFLDYVTQTVKYETVIDRVRQQTLAAMQKNFTNKNEEQSKDWEHLPYQEIRVEKSGYFQNFNEKILLELACEEDFFLTFLYPPATYLIKDLPLARVYHREKVSDDCLQKISSAMDFFNGQPIDQNADYGFRQLAEIAIKALSPGINDPGTAVLALNSLADLLAYRMHHHLPELLADKDRTVRIYRTASTFTELFDYCLQPIWNYGKKDRYIQRQLLKIIKQLQARDTQNQWSAQFNKFRNTIDREILNGEENIS